MIDDDASLQACVFIICFFKWTLIVLSHNECRETNSWMIDIKMYLSSRHIHTSHYEFFFLFFFLSRPSMNFFAPDKESSKNNNNFLCLAYLGRKIFSFRILNEDVVVKTIFLAKHTLICINFFLRKNSLLFREKLLITTIETNKLFR